MVYNRQSVDNDTMPQMVPSAGFTPPCDYSAFAADSFDLSLLPGGETDLPLSPSTQLYTQSPPPAIEKPKIYTTFYPNSPEEFQTDIELNSDIQKLLGSKDKNTLEVPTNNFYPASPVGSLSSYCSTPEHQLYQQNSLISPQYPSSPDTFSLYPNSPQLYTIFPGSPQNINNQFIKKEEQTTNFTEFQIKEEGFLSPCSQVSSPISCSSYSNHSSPGVSNHLLNEVFLENSYLDKEIKQESTVDFSELLQNLSTFKGILEDDIKKPEPSPEEGKPKSQDHQLLRQVLKDTSFQKKYNLKPFDFGLATGFVGNPIKMEEQEEGDLLSQDKIEPVISLAMEQMKKDVCNTCNALGISQDPSQWSSEHVRAWIQWTSQQFNLTAVQSDLFDISGADFILLSEEDFTQRAPQNGSILHAQLEIWKAACLEDEISMNWTTSNVPNTKINCGDASDDDEEESPSNQSSSSSKPAATRTTGSSHIHLWQFLKELLASPAVHGSCIRWLDRGKGVFKIEDSVKVAKLWGKRKNRPAMNYDKLSRSIRQYYKKGIMKKTERSQRLVYQFCHPYSL